MSAVKLLGLLIGIACLALFLNLPMAEYARFMQGVATALVAVWLVENPE